MYNLKAWSECCIKVVLWVRLMLNMVWYLVGHLTTLFSRLSETAFVNKPFLFCHTHSFLNELILPKSWHLYLILWFLIQYKSVLEFLSTVPQCNFVTRNIIFVTIVNVILCFIQILNSENNTWGSFTSLLHKFNHTKMFSCLFNMQVTL